MLCNEFESHVGLPIDFLIDLLIIVLDPKKRDSKWPKRVSSFCI